MPVWSLFSNAGEKIEIHTLVNDACIAQTWMRDIELILRVTRRPPSGGKEFAVDAAGKTVDPGMLATFGFEKTLSAGEDQVSAFEQFTFRRP
jgi:hypothetical protein